MTMLRATWDCWMQCLACSGSRITLHILEVILTKLRFSDKVQVVLLSRIWCFHPWHKYIYLLWAMVLCPSSFIAFQGLFHQVLPQSGAAVAPWAFEEIKEHEYHTRRMAENLDCNKESVDEMIACLKDVPVAELTKAAGNYSVCNKDLCIRFLDCFVTLPFHFRLWTKAKEEWDLVGSIHVRKPMASRSFGAMVKALSIHFWPGITHQCQCLQVVVLMMEPLFCQVTPSFADAQSLAKRILAIFRGLFYHVLSKWTG